MNRYCTICQKNAKDHTCLDAATCLCRCTGVFAKFSGWENTLLNAAYAIIPPLKALVTKE